MDAHNMSHINQMFGNFTVFRTRTLKHDHFVSSIDENDCSYVFEVEPDDRCQFVMERTGCRSAVTFDYMWLLFCSLPVSEVYFVLCIAFLILWCLYLFVILSSASDDFFCPSLNVLSKLMRLSQSVAGVTILSFGNGTPEMFNTVIHFDEDTVFQYAELLGTTDTFMLLLNGMTPIHFIAINGLCHICSGGSMFLISFVAGVVCIIRPFSMPGNSFLRISLFLLFSIILIQYIVYDERVSIVGALACIFIYVLFLVLILGEYFYKRYLREKKRRADEEEEGANVSLRPPEQRRRTVSVVTKLEMGRAFDLDYPLTYDEMDIDQDPKSLCGDLIYQLTPITSEEWREMTKLERAYAIIKLAFLFMCCSSFLSLVNTSTSGTYEKAPALFYMKLMIPVVDVHVVKHGWCKMLNVIQCITLPMFVLLTNRWHHMEVYPGIELYMVVLPICVLLAIIVFATTRTDRSPKYHIIFVVAGFTGSVFIVSTIADEIVALLETMGRVLSVSSSTIGITALCWGNSMGDLISNIVLSKQGYQQMAFAACFGGPLFNILIGLGLNFLMKVIASDDGIATVRSGALGVNCTVFLIMTMCCIIFMLLLTNFKVHRSLAVLLFILYGIFLLFCFLAEAEIMHPFGTDHVREEEEDVHDILENIL